MRADDILKDGEHNREFGGVNVRKGTIAAFIANARIVADPKASSVEVALAQDDIVNAVPALRAVGLFDVMTIRNDRVQRIVDSVA